MIKNMIIFGTILIIALLAFRLFLIKKQLRRAAGQLAQKAPECSFISVEMVDKDVDRLIIEINRLLIEKDRERIRGEKNLMWEKEAIAAVSHDMRTPLTAMLGYLQLLEREPLTQVQKDDLDTVMRKTQSLYALIQDFFELSALEANPEPPVLEKIDLPTVISECILDHYPQFEARGMVPEFPDSRQPVFVLAQRNMLERIVQNLITNGIRYSSGRLSFFVEAGRGFAVLKVKNSVDNAGFLDVEHIFDKFYKADKSRAGQSTGLGLATVKVLAEKMDGAAGAKLEGGELCILVKLRLYDSELISQAAGRNGGNQQFGTES